MSLIQLSPDILPAIVTRLDNMECELRIVREHSVKQTALIQEQNSVIQELKALLAAHHKSLSDGHSPTLRVDVPGADKVSHPSSRPLKRQLTSKVDAAPPATPSKKAVVPSVNLSPASVASDSAFISQRAARQQRRNVKNIAVISSPSKSASGVAGCVIADAVLKTTEANLLREERGTTDQIPLTADVPAKPTRNGDDWTEVRRKKPRQSLSMRCVAGPAVTSLKAVEVRKYLHLWNMLSGAEEIEQYMNQLCPQKAFTVEELITSKNYKSFKIGVPEDCFAKCLSVNVWPENARIKTWINYKKHSLDNRTFHREVGDHQAV